MILRKHWRLSFCLGVILGLIAAAGIACGDEEDETSPEPSTTTAALASAAPMTAPSNTVWLCRPGLADNPCESDMTTTVIAADGTSTTEQVTPATDPPIDCFYVYPTVSDQTTVNADLTIDPQETAVVIQQAARFSQVCKVYAPMYRQMTLKTINSPGGDPTAARDVAYSDVLAAWQDYLAHYNNGRGVVFIGHSQGTMMLTRLIAAEIDPNAELRDLLVSALMIGGNVTVATGEDVGGDFQNIPACQSTDQTGCVVAYSSFSEPPPAGSFFGKVGVGPNSGKPAARDLEVLCVNPASLSGGTGTLQTEFATAPFPGTIGIWLKGIPSAPTPWMSYPNRSTAHCASTSDSNWLQVDATSIPGDTRPIVSAAPTAEWGLHLYDVTLALGNLVELVASQAAAFTE